MSALSRRVEDKALSWGAKASAYHDGVFAALARGETPVLIELEEACLTAYSTDCDPRRDPASTAPLRLRERFRRRGALVHVARFDVRAALQAFQARDRFALFGDRLRQSGDLSAQFRQQGLKPWTVWRGNGRRRRHMTYRLGRVGSGQGNNWRPSTILPLSRPPILCR